jgi:hypothetical protein
MGLIGPPRISMVDANRNTYDLLIPHTKDPPNSPQQLHAENHQQEISAIDGSFDG